MFFLFFILGPLVIGVSLDEAEGARDFLMGTISGADGCSTTLLDKQDFRNLRGGTAGLMTSSITSFGVRAAAWCLGELSLFRFLHTPTAGNIILVVRGAGLQLTTRFEGEVGASFSLGGSGKAGGCVGGVTKGACSGEEHSGAFSDFPENSTLSSIKVVTLSM